MLRAPPFRPSFILCHFSVNAFPSTLAKLVSKLEMLVGNYTVWNTEFSLMARCQATRPSVEETIPLTRFSAKLEQESTSLAQCSLTWNRPLLVSNNINHLDVNFSYLSLFIEGFIRSHH